MFSQIPQPLEYAEALLAHFSRLSQSTDSSTLLSQSAQAMAQLTGCQLSQLYLLDASRERLELKAQWLEGTLHPALGSGRSADHGQEPLLQYAISQNRVVDLSNLDSRLHNIDFLPRAGEPWRSLLAVPMRDSRQTVAGVWMLASCTHTPLHGYAPSLGALGSAALMQMSLLERRPQQGKPLGRCVSAGTLIGSSPVMRKTYQLINRVVHSPYTVLLLGETGTGKEVVARAIHDSGPRRAQPFIVQNCAAFPEDLLESELFGYRKGAFTGADRDRKGLFDAAHGGTLLLDEIGDMPLALQAKLLRVLQEGEIRPLGCTESHTIDVRIIAATHCDLKQRVRQGRFREDLYYRLAQFPVVMPALRERGKDIFDLATHFAAQTCAFLQRRPVVLADSAMAQLACYAFPGNVRELKGLVERAVLLCDGHELLAEHFALPSELNDESGRLNFRKRMDAMERGLLLDCLRRNAGNQTLAAQELGLARRTLLYRLGRLNINSDEIRAYAS